MRNGFELLDEQFIPEIDSQATLWRHEKSGAEFLSLVNDDTNKVFCIAFRTPPPDSTGIIHVLEHATLQGSSKYPVKDVITELVKGSMKTFINMLSYPDKTLYPVASQNVRDLYNLIDVFLDGVFYPLLAPQTFKQEGWHYALKSLDSPLNINGIVYNEQKGNFAMDFKRIAVESQKALFPETIYRHAYGGDPAEVPELTYEQLKTYHQTYYHPANARIFWYGDDNPDERLQYLDSWLKEFEHSEIDSEIPLQPRFDHPRSVVVPHYVDQATDPAHKQGIFTLNWMLDEVGDPELMLALDILAHLLIGTSTSPLQQALSASQLGDGLAGIGLWKHARQMYFSTGLTGIDPANAEKVETVINDTLKNIVNNRLAPDLVMAAMNTIEFQLREANFERLPRGLGLFQERAMTTWIHGFNPLEILAFAAPLQTIKEHLSKGERYFEQLIRTRLIDNVHRASVLLTPDSNVNFETVTRTKLDKLKASLNKEALQNLVEGTQALLEYQQKSDSPEIVAKIPALKLGDLDKQTQTIPIQINRVEESTVLHHDISTGGILYLDLAFDLRGLSPGLLVYAPILGSALLKMASSQLSQHIGQMTGGITSTVLSSAKVDRSGIVGQLVFRGKAMIVQADTLLDILPEILLETKLDNRERFRQLVVEMRTRLEANLAPRGFQVVAQRIGAQWSKAGWLAEQLTGVEQIFFLRQLESEVETNWTAVLQRLEETRNTLINRHLLTVNMTVDSAQLENKVAKFVASLPGKPVDVNISDPDIGTRNEGLFIPSTVNFVGKGANIFDLGYVLNGSIAAIVNYLEMNWLWNLVRIQGGAYAGICLFDPLSGVLTFTSYRDPHIGRTLNIYDHTAEFLQTLILSETERVKCIIGALSRIDAYQRADAQGYTSLVRYLTGETDDARQKFRDELLTTTTEDFHMFSEVLSEVKDQGSIVVMGSPDAVEKMNVAGQPIIECTKVL